MVRGWPHFGINFIVHRWPLIFIFFLCPWRFLRFCSVLLSANCFDCFVRVLALYFGIFNKLLSTCTTRSKRVK